MKLTSRRPTTVLRSVTDTMSQGKPHTQSEKDKQIQRIRGGPGVRSGGEAPGWSQPGNTETEELLEALSGEV